MQAVEAMHAYWQVLNRQYRRVRTLRILHTMQQAQTSKMTKQVVSFRLLLRAKQPLLCIPSNQEATLLHYAHAGRPMKGLLEALVLLVHTGLRPKRFGLNDAATVYGNPKCNNLIEHRKLQPQVRQTETAQKVEGPQWRLNPMAPLSVYTH